MRWCRRRAKLSLGFSLIELFTVLTISAILAICIVPAYKIFLDRTDHQAASTQLLRAISLARSEAIMLGAPVILCGSKNLQTCANDWRDGYIVRSQEKVLYVFQPTTKGILRWRGSLGLLYLKFLPTGLLNTEDGTYWYCLPSEKFPAWAIVINHPGRTRLVYPDQNGKILDSKGKGFIC
ncbi:MAG: GspH/FimT family pseudopilin [Gammaproteobacteria bacterium]